MFAPMRRLNPSGYLLMNSRWNYPIRRPFAVARLGSDCDPYSPWRIGRGGCSVCPPVRFERHYHGVAAEVVPHTLFHPGPHWRSYSRDYHPMSRSPTAKPGKAFTDQAVIAIENTRLFEEVQPRTRDATDALEY